ncbi:MAG: hypothetical protein ABSB80_09305 [Methanoregula sp.]|jgi:hypothetical protein|uniref:hypothetical protein n=1 Tax=Methanoregula sp. TaxID=2052170 RepID=UPI003D0BE8C1
MNLPLESKVWYLWIFNLFVTLSITIFLFSSVNDIKNRTPILPENSDRTKREIIKLFKSEISRIEKNLNSIPDASRFPDESRNTEMVKYAMEIVNRGNPHIFQSTPVYSQYQKEMLQFSEVLRDRLIAFYESIELLHRNEDFPLVIRPGSNLSYIQIKTYFEIAKKAREQIQNLKRLFEIEMQQD